MMMRRRGAPLLRMAAGTAVIAGTAGAVRHRQENKWNQQAAAQQADQEAVYQQGANDQAAAQQAAAQQAAYQQAPPAPAAPRLDEELRKLADLHSSGILTDEEFAAAKAQLLARV
jgi:Short C-terminal domain